MDANSIRDRSTKFLADSIKSSVGSSSGTSQAIASEIEATLYQAHDEETANPYRQDVRTKGLAIKQNNELAGQLVSGQLSGEQVAGMDDEQLKTQARAAEDQDLRSQGLQNSMGLPETHEQVGPPLNMGADNISGSEPDPLTGVEQDMDQEMDGEMKLQIN